MNNSAEREVRILEYRYFKEQVEINEKLLKICAMATTIAVIVIALLLLNVLPAPEQYKTSIYWLLVGVGAGQLFNILLFSSRRRVYKAKITQILED